MKTTRFLMCLLFITNFISLFSQLKVNSLGYVGINTSNPVSNLQINGPSSPVNSSITTISGSSYGPCVNISGSSSYSYEFYVSGEAYSTIGWQGSDETFKKNIQNIEGKEMLSKIMNIDGKKYTYKTPSELSDTFNFLTKLPVGNHYGFIAQEVEIEFPELVRSDSFTHLKAINYDGMIPILLAAIKEQQFQINELKSNILANKKSAVSESLQSSQESSSILYSNIPNPFSEKTEIKYEIGDDVVKAMINVYDLQGYQVKTYPITMRGNGSVIINGNELKPGMYLYSLIVNSQEIDTKRMILTE
jgi:hypothetical protein